MAKNETPQPLTKEEFEAGVEFYYSPSLQPYDYMDSYKKRPDGFIENKKGMPTCYALYIDNDGFKFIHYVFGHQITANILFSQCFKSIK